MEDSPYSLGFINNNQLYREKEERISLCRELAQNYMAVTPEQWASHPSL